SAKTSAQSACLPLSPASAVSPADNSVPPTSRSPRCTHESARSATPVPSTTVATRFAAPALGLRLFRHSCCAHYTPALPRLSSFPVREPCSPALSVLAPDLPAPGS